MSRGLRARRRGVVAAAALIALPACLGTTTASAAPVSLNLNYTCSFPLMAPQPLSLKISSDIPTTVAVGGTTDAFPISANAEVSAVATKGLRALEAVSVEGTANAAATVTLSGGTPVALKVPTTIPKTDIPVSGAFTTAATGSTPPLTFDDPGTVTIKVGDLVLSLTPRLADGTLSGLDKFETECFLAPGQNTTLATITVGSTVDDVPPSKPTALTGIPAQTSVALSWTPSSDNVAVSGYDVFKDGIKVATVTGNSASITGLTANTAYKFKVQARDAAGNLSAASDETTIKTTGGGTVAYGYGITGTAGIKTLSKGNVPLTGSINASLTLATGAFSADLLLNNANARLTALGFLPITAKLGFVPSGKTTGNLQDGVLKSSSLVRIKVLEVKLFGAIPLAGGNSCQTKSLSKIDLKSTDPEFVPTVGGTLAGTFAISDLNGCGALNGLVSPLTAGGGNTISLKLTPKPTV